MARTACVICGNEAGNRIHGDYVECAACGGLQTRALSAELSRHRLDGFHPLPDWETMRGHPVTAYLKSRRARYCLGHPDALGRAVSRVLGVPEPYRWLRRCRVEREQQILEVGCGTGRLLCALAREGFRHLTGVEPLLPEAISYPNGVRILKLQLGDVEQQFDFVLLDRSFTRLPDPVSALWELSRLLRRDRYLFIRLPLASVSGLDVSRQRWLPTVQGMETLAERVGFNVEHVETERADLASFCFYKP